MKGMTWDHPRGNDPLVAASRARAERGGEAITWDRRSLQGFESYPVEDLARTYDLIVTDHPHVGQVAGAGCLMALDRACEPAALADIARGSVGGSHESYRWGGRQRALPIDAAAQVQAWVPARFAAPPADWAAVLDLAREGRLTLPLRPPHSLMSLFGMAGVVLPTDGDRLFPAEATAAYERLAGLAALVGPDAYDLDPIAVLEAMAAPGARLAAAPLIYGYVSYARAGFRAARVAFRSAHGGPARLGAGRDRHRRVGLRAPTRRGGGVRGLGGVGRGAARALRGRRRPARACRRRGRRGRNAAVAGSTAPRGRRWTAHGCARGTPATCRSSTPRRSGSTAGGRGRGPRAGCAQQPLSRQPMSAVRPLDGLIILDMAQFLSGPSAALRLGDLGARVVKVERPGTGDICHTLDLSDTEMGGDSTLFHAINRGKESIVLDYARDEDRARLMRLAAWADVAIQNFRPGVADRLGVGPQALRAADPGLVVGTISGYGDSGPWATLPGQDLLAQALSGVMWLNGSAGDGPVPVGLSVADMLAGHVLVEGVLAALVRRGIDGGAHVETSLLEALVDFQFEVLTTYLNDGGRPPRRAAVANAHAYLAAPYGVYLTADGWLAIAMTPLVLLEPLVGLPLAADPFVARDAIRKRIAARLAEDGTDAWMVRLRADDFWCASAVGQHRAALRRAFGGRDDA